jgi:hypothetical protein
MRHFQRHEEVVVAELRETLAADPFDDDGQQVVAGIRIGIFGARLPRSTRTYTTLPQSRNEATRTSRSARDEVE